MPKHSFGNNLSLEARRVASIIIGFLLFVTGAIMAIPLVPGPGIVIMLAGLAILSKQYSWARRFLRFINSTRKRLDPTNRHG